MNPEVWTILEKRVNKVPDGIELVLVVSREDYEGRRHVRSAIVSGATFHTKNEGDTVILSVRP